jgi:phosphoglycolate phosphatase
VTLIAPRSASIWPGIERGVAPQALIPLVSGFRAVVFDYDGTLFDTRPAIIHCIQRTFAEAGRPLPDVDAIAATVRTGIPLHDTLIALEQRLANDRVTLEETVGVYRRIYLAEAAPFLKPYLGVAETLQGLYADGIKNLIVSNKGSAAIHKSLAESDLDLFVDMVFGDEPNLPKKPDPQILTSHVLPRYAGLSTDQILVIGDTETDILFAKAAGVASCWASYGYGEPDRCRALRPDHIITTIEQLPALVHSGHSALRA